MKRPGYRERKRIFEGVRGHALHYLYEFNEFMRLFYPSEKKREYCPYGIKPCKACSPDSVELMNDSAKHFFGDLFYILVDRTIINVCRLMDPHMQGDGKYRNLTVYTLHESSSHLPSYPESEATALISKLRSAAGTVRDWRDQHAAHLAYDQSLGNKKLKSLFVPTTIQRFHDLMTKYLNLVSMKLYSEPYNPSTPGIFGVFELMRTIRDGVALRRILNVNVRHYEDALHGRVQPPVRGK
jgi:hypothetical protein